MRQKPPERNQDYRQEARNIRAKALEVHDAETRAQLLVVASLYDQLASYKYSLSRTARPLR